MDRKKKLYLICGAALILLVFIVTALILSAEKRNAPPPEPEPTPIETIAPAITPGNPASPTEAESPKEPSPIPTQTPELPDATITDSPEPTATPTVSATPKPSAKPTTTAKPTAVPNVELPSGTSNTATPKPTAAPKPTAEAAAGFDFSLPTRANEKVSVTVAANTAKVESVTWKASKKGFLGIQTDAGSEATGTLTKSGGTLAFASAGTYTVTATAKTADGKSATVSHDIEIKASDSFNFSMPLTADTDTVVHVQVLNGAEAAAWEVMKDGSAIQQSDAFAGTLDKAGGFITFRNEGKYTVTGSSRSGKEVSVKITVSEKRA